MSEVINFLNIFISLLLDFLDKFTCCASSASFAAYSSASLLNAEGKDFFLLSEELFYFKMIVIVLIGIGTVLSTKLICHDLRF